MVSAPGADFWRSFAVAPARGDLTFRSFARKADAAMLERLPQPLRKPIGLTIGWSFFLFSLLAVPLSAVTLMRWEQLPWWGALIGVLVVSLIPYAGRFAYFGLALIGAYYWVEAGFSFSEAVGRFID
jgi:hypothetical protein